MKIRFLLPLLLIAICFLHSAARSHEDDIVLSLYVSPTGDDNNPGTKEKPFKTIAKAQETLRNTKLDREGDKEIHLLEGAHYLTEPLRFGPEDGGTVGSTYQQVFYEGHNALISGGKPISGFRDAGDGIVVADLPEVKEKSWFFRDLYVNDRRAVRARYPNEGFLHVKKSGEDHRTHFFFEPGDIEPVDDLDHVELVFLHDWSITRTPVQSIDSKQSRLTVPRQIGGPLPFFAIDGFEPNARYFLENSKSYLDAPGEWFLDQNEGKLYYKLLPEETADTIQVVAPVIPQLIVLEGTQETSVVNLHFCNLAFGHTTFQEKSGKTYWGTQAATYTTPIARETPNNDGKMFDFQHVHATPAAMQWDFVENCTIGNCQFRHIGENALWIGKSCYANLVQKSLFEDIGANGVMIGTHSHNDTARCNVLAFSKVTRTGQTLFGSVGVWIGLTQNSTVDRCEVSDTPYTGVSIGWQWNDSPTPARENMVMQSHLHHNMQILSDGGAIYTLGRQPGSRLGLNHIHDIPLNAGRAESNGMFLDEGTTDFTIDHNLITDTARPPLRFHRAGKNLVENNDFSLPPDNPVIVTYNSTPEENIELVDNATGDKETVKTSHDERVKNMFFDYRTR